MKIYTCILFFAVFASSATGQIYKCTKGKITFFSEAPIENINATTNSVNSFIKSSDKTIAFIIPVSTFIFEKALMQEHFNEKYMESDKYPNSTFSGKFTEPVSFDKDGTYSATVTGKLNIHGVENTVTQPGKITVSEGKIHLESEFTVSVKEYNIEIPKLLFQNIAEDILIKINADYSLLEK